LRVLGKASDHGKETGGRSIRAERYTRAHPECDRTIQ
jgi:hypothetical protein